MDENVNVGLTKTDMVLRTMWVQSKGDGGYVDFSGDVICEFNPRVMVGT